MTTQFKWWVVWLVVGTALTEGLLYFLIAPDYRFTAEHQALMWLMLPFGAIYSLMISPTFPLTSEDK